MWEKLQAKYVMPPSSSLPAYQRQGAILSGENGPAGSGHAGSSGHASGSGLSPGGAAAQGAPTEGVSNTSAPASLSTAVASSGAAPEHDVAGQATAAAGPQPNTGLLSRLLSKMAAAKRGAQQQGRQE